MFKAPAGAAIDEAERRRRIGEFGKRWPRLIGRAFDVLAHLDQITIGAINGYAVGGGWSFALAFDFAIAVEGAEFWVPEVDLDVPYRGAPASVLAAGLGPWRAKEAILLCRHYKAEELLAMGALNRVVKPDALMPAARELAKTLSAKSRDALAASKRDINAVFFGPRPF
jgi:enoyl-CoA hydratase/carnithine racemase